MLPLPPKVNNKFKLELDRYLEVMEIEVVGMLIRLFGSLSIDG